MPNFEKAKSGLIVPSRRGFVLGLGALFAAPAIIKIESLMPVKIIPAGDFGDFVYDGSEMVNLNYLFRLPLSLVEKNPHDLVQKLLAKNPYNSPRDREGAGSYFCWNQPVPLSWFSKTGILKES